MNLPPPLNWLWTLWKKFAELLGRVMSWIMLSILWVVGFGTYAVILKMINFIRPRKKESTYWVDPPEDFPNSMKYQF